MGKLKIRGVTCPRSHWYLVAEPGLKFKIDCSRKPLLWKQSANNGLSAKMAPLTQCTSQNRRQGIIFLIGQTLLTWKKIYLLANIHWASIASKALCMEKAWSISWAQTTLCPWQVHSPPWTSISPPVRSDDLEGSSKSGFVHLRYLQGRRSPDSSGTV